MGRRKTQAKLEGTRAIGYIRVSTAKQAEKGLSLEAQRAKLEAYATLYEIELAEVIVDAASAKSLDRPGLQTAFEKMERGEVNALIIVKLDRLTRSVRDLGAMVERFFAGERIALLSVSEQIDTRSAAGRLVLNVLGSVSQWEREAIGERTSATMQHHSASGGYVGGRAPFGFVSNEAGELVQCEPEQLVITAARDLRAGHSLREVSAALAARGMVDRQGKNFHPQAIARFLGETDRAFASAAALSPG